MRDNLSHVIKPYRSKGDVWDTLNLFTLGLKNTHFDFCALYYLLDVCRPPPLGEGSPTIPHQAPPPAVGVWLVFFKTNYNRVFRQGGA